MVTIKPRFIALAAALLLSGCGLFAASDQYGNRYGGIFDFGNQYGWQLAACDSEMAANPVPVPERKRAMECCMWRHGVPIDNPAGCSLPPQAG